MLKVLSQYLFEFHATYDELFNAFQLFLSATTVATIKYCTGSSARSYQCKYAVNEVFANIDSVEELGAAIKKVIHYYTIRGRFSSVHPDLVAEGITRVEMGGEGLHFIRDNQPGIKSKLERS